MLTKNEFESLLKERGTLILDGALATELEARGQDLNHPLWSAKTLQHSPDSIEQVHFDYFIAGADIAITASYQATTHGLKEHFDMPAGESLDLIKKSVRLAQSARDEAYKKGITSDRKLLVAGSVGPYGAYLANGSEYTGDYGLPIDAMKDFHRPRIQALIDAGADLLALETIPNISEIEALLDLLQEYFPSAIAWLSCTVKSQESLSDGTPWDKVLSVVNNSKQIVGFGINCIPLSVAPETLESIRSHTELPLVCYPNSGEIWDATTNTWHCKRPDEALDANEGDAAKSGLAVEVRSWTATGTTLIGGCCRTGPAFIKAIRQAVVESSA